MPMCLEIVGQGGVTVKVVSQSRSYYSQGGVTVKVVSRSRWFHSQGNVTVKVEASETETNIGL